MSEAMTENKLTVMIKRVLWNSIYIGNVYVETKIMTKVKNITSPSTPVTVSLIAEKLLSLWLWKFFRFSVVSFNCYCRFVEDG